jgi:hypothetical protein
VIVLASEDSVDYIKTAASRHSSNSTAEAMQYVLFDNKFGIGKTIDTMMQQAGKAFKEKSKLGGGWVGGAPAAVISRLQPAQLVGQESACLFVECSEQ